MPKTTISEALTNFFKVEIDNENAGGVTPATLGSALDSLDQAPDDVAAEWCQVDEGWLESIYGELQHLIKQYGDDAEVREFLDD